MIGRDPDCPPASVSPVFAIPLRMEENAAISHFTMAKNLAVWFHCGHFNRRQGFVI
jgi:hypothetical protein